MIVPEVRGPGWSSNVTQVHRTEDGRVHFALSDGVWWYVAKCITPCVGPFQLFVWERVENNRSLLRVAKFAAPHLEIIL